MSVYEANVERRRLRLCICVALRVTGVQAGQCIADLVPLFLLPPFLAPPSPILSRVNNCIMCASAVSALCRMGVLQR